MELGHLYFTIGLPRSGKSTLCRQWVNWETNIIHNQFVKGLAGNANPRVIIEGDAFRLALHGCVYAGLAEPTVYSMMDVATRALLNTGHDVIIDETATSEYALERYYKIDIFAEHVVIPTSADICKERATKLGQNYLLPVIDRLNDQLTRLKSELNDNLEVIRRRIRARDWVAINVSKK